MHTNRYYSCFILLSGFLASILLSCGSMHTSDKVVGYQGEVFTIERPKVSKLHTVNAAQFGLDTAATNNSDAMRDAFAYCAEHPGTRLVINPGVYHFDQRKGIVVKEVNDCLIDGPEAKFVTGRVGTFFDIRHCRCLEWRGLSFDWERDTDPIDDVVRVQNVDSTARTLDLLFFQRDAVSETMTIKAMTQCDPNTLTFGAEGSSEEVYFYSSHCIDSVSRVAPNVLRLHLNRYPMFSEGIIALLRHYVYDGTTFHLGGESRDVTFQSLHIFGSPGMALVADDRASHFQILDTYIGVDPALQERHHVSLGADAIHAVNTDGCIRIEGCDISRQGDDAVNIHDGLGYIFAVDKDKASMYASNMPTDVGDMIAFKDRGYADLPLRVKVVSVSYAKGHRTVTFDRPIADSICEGCTAWNTSYESSRYVLRHNTFHENRARGLLLQSSKGVCEDNIFYKIEGPAIRVVMDIIPALWQEGTGVDGLTIRGNTFDTCDYSHWGRVLEISTNIDGRKAEAIVFRNIEITHNTFTGCHTQLLDAANVEGLVCDDELLSGKPQ